MKMLINGLSATNISGLHVLLGHLTQVARWTSDEHSYVVLYHSGNADIVRDLGNNVDWVECPSYTAQWLGRFLWETAFLPGLARKLNAAAMFTPAGVAVPSLTIPQVVFCQNPWSLVGEMQHSPMDKIKAFLQRRAYRYAMSHAAVMVFNSHYMQDSYRALAKRDARNSIVAYQCPSNSLWEAADTVTENQARTPGRIVTISAMAPHKGVEVTVRALAILRDKYGVQAELHLVGGWPDSDYEAAVRNEIARLDLASQVTFAGHVSEEDLHMHYAKSKVFCLMSRCESFGIPAVEAQAFGTPVVSSNCCAIPEICGDGGVFPHPLDADEVANELRRLLTDDAHWKQMSAAARNNARRFKWESCSQPLLKMFDYI